MSCQFNQINEETTEKSFLINKIENYRTNLNLTGDDEDDDIVEFKIIDNLGFYIRYNSAWAPSFIIHLDTLNIFEFDHGFKGGYDINTLKFENGKIIAEGRILGQVKKELTYDYRGTLIL